MHHDLKPYPAYKDSGVPWMEGLPATWKALRGKVVFRVLDVRSETGQEELLTVSSADGVVPRSQKTVTMFKAESYVGHKLCWPGDLVINSLWAWMQGLGFAENHGLVSSAYSVYRPRPAFSTYASYFHYALRSAAYKWELQTRSKGVWLSRLQLSDAAFLDMPIPVPPVEELSAMVRFLDHADRRVRRYSRAKQKVIKLLEEQKQAIIHRAVTRGLDPDVRLKPSGIDWLGDVPEHWEVKKLKYNVRFLGGGTPSKAVAEYWNGDIPWVSPKDMKRELIEDAQDHITQEAVERSSTHLVDAGAVLLVVRSGILRRTIPVAINQRTVALNQDMKALVTGPGLTARYLAALIRGNQHVLLAEWTKHGATVESVEHELLANTRIPVPPVDEQQAIVASLDKELRKVNQPIDRARRAIDLLREYRTRLIADVVTGKLDVCALAATLPEINTDEPLDDAMLDEGSGSKDDLDDAVEHAAMSFDE